MKDLVGATYTYGTIVARLSIPAGTKSIATAIVKGGHSSLFASAFSGLFVFTPDRQDDGFAAIQIINNAVVASASQLSAMTAAGFTIVWGLDSNRTLFYTRCHAGSEADPSAWSTPIPPLPKVESFGFYTNNKAGNNILFVHIAGQQIMQLTQDSVTSSWIKRSILLPTTDGSLMNEYNAFATRMEVIGDNGLQQKYVDVILTSFSSVSVFINDNYYLLSVDAPSLVFHIVDELHEVWCRSEITTTASYSTVALQTPMPPNGCFGQIKMLVEDLIAYLGFVSMWKDIVRTHKVIKNLFTEFANNADTVLDHAESTVTNGLDGLQANSLGHVACNGKFSQFDITTASIRGYRVWYIGPGDTGSASSRNRRTCILEERSGSIADTSDQPKYQILVLSPAQVIHRFSAIIGGVLIQTAKNVVVKSLHILKVLLQGVSSILATPITIPILSPFYRRLTGDDLSFLDLMCLIAAIPATNMYTIFAGSAPVSDDSTTDALINAKDFMSFKSIVRSRRKAITQGSSKFVALAAAAVNLENIYTKFRIIGQYLGMAGSWATMFLSYGKLPFIEFGLKEAIPDWVSRTAIPRTLLSLAPSIITAFGDSEPWGVIMTDVVISLQFLKVCVNASNVLGKNDVYKKISPCI
ncbi:MAG: hypothetical protein Q9223_001224 [Gallowayella weberi]